MSKLKRHILPILWDKAMAIPEKAWIGFEIMAPLLGAVAAFLLIDLILVRENLPTIAIIGAYGISIPVAYFCWEYMVALHYDVWAVKQSFQKVASQRKGSAIHRLWVEALKENFNLIYLNGEISSDNMSAPMDYFRERVGLTSDWLRPYRLLREAVLVYRQKSSLTLRVRLVNSF